ncbi:MAG: CHRD domain-containing protein [Novosphingobium sp.]|nr:CHRD domain-containing protein [Novosphingobium sp.]
MKKFVSTALGGTTLGAFAAAIAFAGMAPASAGEHKDPDKVMPASGVKLMADLMGMNEVPGPGDKDGSGIFKARLNPGSGQMCYEIKVDDIDDTTGAHIHRGSEGVNGEVVVAFKDLDDGKVSDCLTVTKDLAQEIIRDPGMFYVNVHDTEHPAGALRGQVMK